MVIQDLDIAKDAMEMRQARWSAAGVERYNAGS